MCSVVTQCTKCSSTTQVPKTDGSGTCAACATNCRTCSTAGPGKCDICTTGYFVNTNGTCSQCNVTNCQTCTAGACTSCKSGYALNNASTPQTCDPCGSIAHSVQRMVLANVMVKDFVQKLSTTMQLKPVCQWSQGLRLPRPCQVVLSPVPLRHPLLRHPLLRLQS